MSSDISKPWYDLKYRLIVGFSTGAKQPQIKQTSEAASLAKKLYLTVALLCAVVGSELWTLENSPLRRKVAWLSRTKHMLLQVFSHDERFATICETTMPSFLQSGEQRGQIGRSSCGAHEMSNSSHPSECPLCDRARSK